MVDQQGEFGVTCDGGDSHVWGFNLFFLDSFASSYRLQGLS